MCGIGLWKKGWGQHFTKGYRGRTQGARLGKNGGKQKSAELKKGGFQKHKKYKGVKVRGVCRLGPRWGIDSRETNRRGMTAHEGRPAGKSKKKEYTWRAQKNINTQKGRLRKGGI